MNYPQNLSESDRRWFDLIQECRTSGKSDRQWLAENNITPPTFYYHVKQLRRKSCDIPESISKETADIHEVVPLFVEASSAEGMEASLLETDEKTVSAAVRLTIKGMTVEISNNATQSVIQNTITALRYLC